MVVYSFGKILQLKMGKTPAVFQRNSGSLGHDVEQKEFKHSCLWIA